MAEPSANAELGDPAYGSDAESVTYEAGEAIEAGDWVDIDSDQLRPANSGDTGVVLSGIAGEAADESGDNITVYVGGRIVGKAATGLGAGVEIAPTTTDGEVDSGTNVRGYASLTPEGSMGGLQHGAGLADNAAVFDLG